MKTLLATTPLRGRMLRGARMTASTIAAKLNESLQWAESDGKWPSHASAYLNATSTRERALVGT